MPVELERCVFDSQEVCRLLCIQLYCQLFLSTTTITAVFRMTDSVFINAGVFWSAPKSRLLFVSVAF